jgi:hypothetical protein
MGWQRPARVASQLVRIFFISRRRLSRSASFCSSTARMCMHGPDFAVRRSIIWRISFSVRPSRRAWLTEVEDAEYVSVVHAIARWGPLRLSQDAACLVETQRLATDPAASSDLTDRQSALCHGPRIDLAPYGKVKGP